MVCFLWWSPWTSKKQKQKCWWWNENILIWYIHMCGKQTFFILGCNLLYETSVSVFFIIVQILTFFVKKKCPIVHLWWSCFCICWKRKNWLSFRSSSSSSSTSPNFQITCVEEQHYVRAWSKGQYVKNTSCSQFPPKFWPFFCWEFDQMNKNILKNLFGFLKYELSFSRLSK